MSKRDEARRTWNAKELARQRRQHMFQHTAWRSPYARDPNCPHLVAIEIENNDPIEHPAPLPWAWFPVVTRWWACAGCGVAVNPHAFPDDKKIALPVEVRKAWWDAWRAYERSINGEF